MKDRIQDAIFLGIDFQERLMPAVYESEKIIKNEMILCELAKYYDVPIMFTEQYPKGLGSTVEVLRQYQTEENTFSKVVFSAYSDIQERVEELHRRTIILSGSETHICVYQTVKDLLKHGYSVMIVSDAVSSRTLENKEIALQQMEKLGATIVSTEMLVFEFLETATSPYFKHFSKLIK